MTVNFAPSASVWNTFWRLWSQLLARRFFSRELEGSKRAQKNKLAFKTEEPSPFLACLLQFLLCRNFSLMLVRWLGQTPYGRARKGLFDVVRTTMTLTQRVVYTHLCQWPFPGTFSCFGQWGKMNEVPSEACCQCVSSWQSTPGSFTAPLNIGNSRVCLHCGWHPFSRPIRPSFGSDRNSTYGSPSCANERTQLGEKMASNRK